jgi:hypothetical protein
MRKLILIFVLIGMVVISCRKDFEGEANAQSAPETYAVVDSVKRDTNNLLTTTVTGHWWAESKTGFIKGYEVSIDNQQTWQFTINQSGTYLLNLPIGFDRGNLPIYVRAIDNEGQTDPTPAKMVFPVKNTPPTIEFDYSIGKKATTLPAFRYNWIPADVDGPTDIQSIEIVLNDTNKIPLTVPGNTIAASFAADLKSGSVDTVCSVFLNVKTTPYTDKLNGILYNQINRVYIRSVDRVGSKSAWVVDSIRIKKPVSDILMINDYRSSKTAVQTFYHTQLTALGGAYNVYDTVQSIIDELPSDEFTTEKTLYYYSKIIWYSDDPNSSLALARLITDKFFLNGGRMFMSVELPNDFPAVSEYFSFTPVQELVVPPNGTILRMNTGAEMTPYIAGAGWPVLKATTILSSARPFVTFSASSGTFTYDSICGANLLAQSTSGTVPWTGPSNVMSKRKKLSNGKTDMIFVSLPLNRLNGNNNMDSLFRKALIGELEF